MEFYRLWVGGSREVPPRLKHKIRLAIKKRVDEILREKDTTRLRIVIVHGGAKGVDQLADETARMLFIATEVHRPDYARYGRGAPLKRNEDMCDVADEALFFWDGQSRGTKHSINLARRFNLKHQVVLFSELTG